MTRDSSTAEDTQKVKVTVESDPDPVILSPGDTLSLTVHGEDIEIEWVDDE